MTGKTRKRKGTYQLWICSIFLIFFFQMQREQAQINVIPMCNTGKHTVMVMEINKYTAYINYTV